MSAPSSVLGVAAALLAFAAPPAPQEAPALDTEETLDALRALAADERWMELAERSGKARSSLDRGSTAWLEASALLGRALYVDWNPDALVELGRDVWGAVREDAGVGPDEPLHPLGKLDPLAAGLALEVYAVWGYALQGKGDHDAAAVALWPIPEALLHRPLPRPSSLVLEAGFALGESLLLAGREEEAKRVFAGVRDQFPGTSAATLATARLQALGMDAYRGKYQGDPAHGERVRELLALVPRARERLASALGRKVDELPPTPVGVADRPSEHDGEVAFTDGDPRRPFSPVTVVFAEALALDWRDPLELLVHELAHAVLLQELGLAYERFPVWIHEGLSNALAGEFEPLLGDYLAHLLGADSAAFLGPRAEEYLRPAFASGGRPSVETGLALAYLEERAGPGALPRFIGELRGGRSLDGALLAVSGLSKEAYLEQATSFVLGKLLAERQAALADLESLERAVRQGPAEGLAAAEAVLARQSSALARGHALTLRAAALEALGEHERSLMAYGELIGERRSQRVYLWAAKLGHARSLAALGRREDALRELSELERAAPDSRARQDVQRVLASLAAPSPRD